MRAGWILCFCSVLPLACQTLNRAADRASDPAAATAAQLASRIASLLPRRATVSIESRSLAQLPLPEWSKFRSRLQEELGKAGVQISGVPAGAVPTATTPPEPRVRVTLSQDAHGLLLVAEVLNGDNRQIAILPWNVPLSAQPNPQASITKKLLWTQEAPVLDVLLADGDSQMLVLGLNSVASYRLMDGKWTVVSSASLALPRPMPRDPRGKLVSTADGFQAFLPVATCTGTWNPDVKATCTNATGIWPGTSGTRWLADRNILLGDAAETRAIEGGGSDAAYLPEACSGYNLYISDSPKSEDDSVRVYQAAMPMSDPLPLPGPVTALWPEASGREAILVVHNLQTGEYEASRLGVACSQ